MKKQKQKQVNNIDEKRENKMENKKIVTGEKLICSNPLSGKILNGYVVLKQVLFSNLMNWISV